MIEATTVLTKGIYKSMTKKLYIGAWLATIIGTAGVITYLVSDFIFNETGWTVWLLAFALPLGFGIVYLSALTKMYKRPMEENSVNIYQFDETGITIVTFKQSENLGAVRVLYSQIEKVKESPDYLFLFVNRVSAFPVEKKHITPANLQLIKNCIFNARK